MKIRSVKTSDAKLFLIKLQKEDGRSYSSIHTIRGVLRPTFQMAVDDDILMKNPFGFQLADVVVNDSVTREAITKDQMRKFLKFVHDDVVYCKYYEVVYILFHTGMRISEFCRLTLRTERLTSPKLQRTADTPTAPIRQGRNESEDNPVFDRTLGYFSNYECVHTYRS